MTVDAIILAGGTLERDLAGVVDVPHKSLIDLGGKSMVERILDALGDAPSVGRIVLVEHDAGFPESVRARASAFVKGGASILASLAAGLGALEDDPERVLVLACDLPFLTGAALEDWLLRCSRREADVHYSFVERGNSERKYPALRHTWVRLKDGTFCGGGLVLITPGAVARARAAMERLTAARKRPWELAGILGLSLLVKLPLGILTVAEAERTATRLFGCPVAGVESPSPELAFNVDGPEELAYARRCLEEA
jgi:molybdopterin-guanine dinucleotide biosynthesis protein A